MIAQSFRVLDYWKVRDLLALRARTEPGKRLVAVMQPLDNREQVECSLDEVSEARSLLEGKGEPPLSGVRALDEALRQVQAEEAWLDAETLVAVGEAIQAAGSCRKYFCQQDRALRLGAHASGLHSLPGLLGALRESFGPRAEVLDSASFELGELRSGIRGLRGRIRQRLEALLTDEHLAPAFQERLITERADRYVVPVRADRRGLVRGFVHDESGSGQTLYVEPTETLEANNELGHLLREEQREVHRVLQRLSAAVRRATTELKQNQEILALLDLRSAAARLSRDYDGCAPHLCLEAEFNLRAARHPLLLFDTEGEATAARAVPIDLRLGRQSRVLVISGPNTGGKTVALKTLGLLQLMLASGLHIPCHPDSRTCLFGKVLADIGDEQSIASNLSTFSGHLTQVKAILEAVDDRSLVLLDEVGTGTDPAEGGALAMALLELLREQGAKTVVTTHLNLVKGYAQLADEVENAAVEFDPQTLEPTYRLHYGVPGASGAFTIARLLGLPETLLQRAQQYLEPGAESGQAVLDELNNLLQQARVDAEEAELLRRRARIEREKRKTLLQDFEAQRRSLLEKARKDARKLVHQAEAKLQQLLTEAEGEGLSTPRQAALTSAIRDVAAVPEALTEPRVKNRQQRQPVIGEMVRHLRLGVDGEVVRVTGGDLELLIGGKKLRCLPDDVELADRPRKAVVREARVYGQVSREGFQSRLLLVGLRVDDALPRLERFLDDALLQNQRQVEVVHGSGEGILRKAVRGLLSDHRAVTAFYAADLSQGGDNVTVVELGS
jgi:DNA mismatch repair protein MutS2